MGDIHSDETMVEPLALVGILAGYSVPTRDSYRTDLRLFTGWLTERQVRLLDVQRTHIGTPAHPQRDIPSGGPSAGLRSRSSWTISTA